MKRKALSALSLLFVISLSGFSGKSLHPGVTAFSGKKVFFRTHFDGNAWIASNYDFQACPNQQYEVAGAAPGDTFHWYVTWADWHLGTTDLGTGSTIQYDFSESDELTLVIDEGTPNEYYYYNTLVACGG